MLRISILLALAGCLAFWPLSASADHLPPVVPILFDTDHSHEDHSGADYSFQTMRRVVFDHVSFRNANLQGADLGEHSLFNGTDFTDANLQGASLRNGESVDGTIFDGADLRGVDFDDAQFLNSSFRGADFRGTDFDELTASFSDFRGAIFDETSDLGGGILRNSDFRGVDFNGALPNADLLGSVYNTQTVFPEGFDPEAAGMNLVPEPASIWSALFAVFAIALAMGSRRYLANKAAPVDAL